MTFFEFANRCLSMRYRMIFFSTRNASKLYEERFVCRRETGLFSTTNELNIYKI